MTDNVPLSDEQKIEQYSKMSQEELEKEIHQAYLDNDVQKSKLLHETKMLQQKSNPDVADSNHEIDQGDVELEMAHILPPDPNAKPPLVPVKMKQNVDAHGEQKYVKLHTKAEESHKGDVGNFMKSIVFGGLDGIITLFAMVASISGSNMPLEVILVLGFAKLVADGLSMGVGDFLSESAEIDFVKSEYEREKWEFDNFEEGEIQEMVNIYCEKGIAKEDAQVILNTMAKYPKFFLDHMMMEELEMQTSQMDENPLKNGFVTLLSFLSFGIVPLFAFLIFAGMSFKNTYDPRFLISILLTLLFLFGLGAAQGHYCNIPWWRTGFLTMLNGGIAALAAYGISIGLTYSFGGGDSLHN